MQPCGVVQPDDQCPRFLGIPLPVGTPSIRGPQGAKNRRYSKKGKANGDGPIHDVIEHFKGGQTCADLRAKQQNRPHNHGTDAEINHPGRG